MSDANYSALRFQRETSWGTIPGVPALKNLRITKEDIAHAKATVVSEEVRSDRQISDLAEVGASASGSFSFEFNYSDMLDWVESAMFCERVTIAIAGQSADLNHTTGVITAPSGTPFADVVPGCFVRLSGFTNPANNKAALVTAKTGTTLTFGAGVFAASQTGAVIAVNAVQMKNGIERHSYFLERQVNDSTATAVFQQFRGMCVDTMKLALESMKIITGTVGFVGSLGVGASASLNGATPFTAAGSDPVMNATSHVAEIKRDGVTMAEKAKSLNLAIKNNLRAKDAIGQAGAFDIGVGEFSLSGSLNIYFHDNTLFDLFVSHGYSSLSWTVTDSLGQTVAFHIPRLNFSSGNPMVTGKNTDNMQTMDFTAIRDAVYDATLLVSFLP